MLTLDCEGVSVGVATSQSGAQRQMEEGEGCGLEGFRQAE